VSATVIDSGSGVNVTTLQLLTYNAGTGACTTPRIDHGAPTYNSGTSAATFLVQRIGGPIASGAEGLVNFCVAANDNVGNAQRTPVGFGAFGIDGKPPQFVSFVPNYPGLDIGCDLTSGTTFVCGHDGSTFWKSGDQSSTVAFKFSDNGSGVDATKGVYTVAGGSSLTATAGALSGNQRTFTFAADFSNVPLTISATTGAGSIAVTESATDAVGNVSGVHSGDALNVTRVRWMRSISALASQFKAAPIVTTQPAAQIIVAGTQAGTNDPLISLLPGGGTAWTFGNTQGLKAIIANMAYDPTAATDTANHPTPILYAITTGGMYAMHITATGTSSSCVGGVAGPNCVDGYCIGGLTKGFGSPALVGAGSTAVAISVDNGPPPMLVGFRTNNLTGTHACQQSSNTAALSGTQVNAVIGTPTANSGTLYWAYDNNTTVAGDRGFVNSTFAVGGASGSFGSLTANNLGLFPRTNSTPGISTISISANLFFADRTNALYQAYTAPPTPAAVLNWPAPAMSAGSLPTIAPIIAGSLVIGTSDAPAVLGYNKTTPTTNWSFVPAGAASQIAAAADGRFYFGDNAGELVALNSDGNAAQWTFKGGGTSPGGKTLLTFTAPTSPPTIDISGIVYFGSNDGRVVALISDSVGTASASDWPTIGHDNCSTNNATTTMTSATAGAVFCQ
jgi:hypothetical protein